MVRSQIQEGAGRYGMLRPGGKQPSGAAEPYMEKEPPAPRVSRKWCQEAKENHMLEFRMNGSSGENVASQRG